MVPTSIKNTASDTPAMMVVNLVPVTYSFALTVSSPVKLAWETTESWLMLRCGYGSCFVLRIGVVERVGLSSNLGFLMIARLLSP